jgi:hypothetical protein
MALPETKVGLDDGWVLTPADLSDEQLDAFHRFCHSSTAGTLTAAVNGPAERQQLTRPRFRGLWWGGTAR